MNRDFRKDREARMKNVVGIVIKNDVELCKKMSRIVHENAAEFNIGVLKKWSFFVRVVRTIFGENAM